MLNFGSTALYKLLFSFEWSVLTKIFFLLTISSRSSFYYSSSSTFMLVV
jgi:hypothetical protein